MSKNSILYLKFRIYGFPDICSPYSQLFNYIACSTIKKDSNNGN